jgi:hypothetical protein
VGVLSAFALATLVPLLGLIAGLVRQAAGLVQQLPDRDLVPPGNQAWQEAGDGVVERQAPLLRQLEQNRGDVGLGQASDPERVAGAHPLLGSRLGEAACEQRRPVASADEEGCPGRACSDELRQ